jgi:hypothetical protein
METGTPIPNPAAPTCVRKRRREVRSTPSKRLSALEGSLWHKADMPVVSLDVRFLG